MLLTTMIIRTLLCKPQEIDAGEFKARDFDKDLIAKHLSEAVQIPTVSMVGEFEGQDKPFHDYHAWLEKTYPLIHKTAEKTVINIAGDGCFRMNMNEIATAVREQLPLIQVVVNNHVLGMVRQWQDLFYEKRYSATVLDDGVDYVKLAEAMGAAGYRATNREEFNKALKKALASDTPVVIDCIINSDDKVWPMVAPGEAISSAFTGDDLKKKQEE